MSLCVFFFHVHRNRVKQISGARGRSETPERFQKHISASGRASRGYLRDYHAHSMVKGARGYTPTSGLDLQIIGGVGCAVSRVFSPEQAHEDLGTERRQEAEKKFEEKFGVRIVRARIWATKRARAGGSPATVSRQRLGIALRGVRVIFGLPLGRDRRAGASCGLARVLQEVFYPEATPNPESSMNHARHTRPLRENNDAD